MRRILAGVVATLALALVAVACSGVFDVRASVETYCATPIPVFTADQSAAQDSVALGCPFGYVNGDGDTVIVVPADFSPRVP